jgi:hypothetical protein
MGMGAGVCVEYGSDSAAGSDSDFDYV